MGLWFLTILIVLGIMLALHYRYEEFHVLKITVIAVALFWMMYSIVSGVLFLFNCFSFTNALFVQLGGVVLVDSSLFARYGKKPVKPVFVKEADIVVMVFGLLALLLTISKFELYHVGQDQGLYQTEALELYMGNFEVEHDFEEYQILEEQGQKEAYMTMLDETWIGYYPSSLSEYIGDTEYKSDVSGMYHGIQTFPAMLALMGRLLGMQNMMQVQTVFYLCSVALLYYAMYEMNIRKGNRLIMTAIFLLSPLVLWISKASYTEMYLSMLVCAYLYFLMEKQGKKWLISMPLIAYAFVHVSFLVMWPIFWIINAWLYVVKKDKQYIYANISNAVGLGIGYCMMGKIAPHYFYMNCQRLYIGNVVTPDNLVMWICAIALLSCIVSVALLKINRETPQKILECIQHNRWIVPILLVGAMIMWIRYGVEWGWFMTPQDCVRPELRQYYGEGMVAFTHLSIYACAMATGFFILPITIGWLLRKGKRVQEKTDSYMVLLLFLYVVIVQTVFFMPEIGYYYYYSRYMTPYVPIICMMAALCFENWKHKVLLPITILSFGNMLYFDAAILQEKDDTVWEWEILEDLAAVMEEEQAVILYGAEVQNTMGPKLQAVAEVEVFPDFSDVQEQVAFLNGYYEHVYVLSMSELEEIGVLSDEFEIIYRDRYQYRQADSFRVGLYPTQKRIVDKEVILYEISCEPYKLGEKLLFHTENRTAEPYVVKGLSGNEMEFSWTDGKELWLQFYLPHRADKEQLRATMEVAHVFNGSQQVKVIVNDTLVCETKITEAGNMVFVFEYPKDGVVDMSFVLSDAVSPKELGMSEDERKLAVALKSIVIE